LVELSIADARALALRAQGFTVPRPTGRVDLRHLRRMFDRLRLIQIDSVNVLVRSHYFPAFSRLGVYPPTLLDRLAYGRRELFEFWGHEASLMPMELWPLMRPRMERAKRGELWGSIVRFSKENAAYVESVYEEVRARGPMPASGLSEKGLRGKGWWDWAPGKTALEWLFWIGRVTAQRGNNFERVYDIVERVIPAEILRAPAPTDEEANRELLAISAPALGVATAKDLSDYFRIKLTAARPRIAELVEEGRLLPAHVEGWEQPAFLDPAARVPRHVDARALVSPFDSLVWERARAQRLFDFHYRIEIYTPSHKRVHGYYVVPFLLGNTLVGRVDLKADRKTGTLLVNAAHLEQHQDARAVAGPLAEELRLLGEWQGLERVRAGARGNLARTLRGALR
jgi:uncharacterized protein YcaQ